MNNTFSINRIWQLIAEDWTEKKKLFGYALWVTVGLLILVAVYWGTHPSEIFIHKEDGVINYLDKEKLLNAYIFGTLFLAAFSGYAFTPLQSKSGRISWLMRPGTPFEKLTALFLVYGVGLLLTYTALAFGILKLAFFFKEPFLYLGTYNLSGINWGYDGAKRTLLWGVCGYFAVQAFFVLGALYFKKLSFLKTAAIFVLVATIFLYTVINVTLNTFGPSMEYLVTRVNLNPWSSSFSITSEFLGSLRVVKSYEIQSMLKGILDVILAFIWAPFFWLVSWVRLKETEIQ